MRRWAKRVATRRISWIDQPMRAGPHDSGGVSFVRRATGWRGAGWWSSLQSQHHQGHMSVPAVPRAAFVVIKAKLVFGRFEAVLDRPAMSFDGDQRFDTSPGRAPCAEERAFAVSDTAPDQQTARPDAAGVVIFSIEVG